MKNVIFFVLYVLCFLAILNPASAQVFRFGLKAGAGLSNLNFSDPDADNLDQVSYAGILYNSKSAFRPTFLVGAVLEYDMTKDFLLSSGLNVSAKFSHSSYEYVNEKKYDLKLKLLYLQIPFNIHYRRAKFFIGAGGYLGIISAGKTKVTETIYDPDGPIIEINNEKIIFGNDPELDNLKRLDAGIRGEIGYGFKTVRLSLAYDHGLSNSAPTGVNSNGFEYKGKLKYQAFYVTATYYWLAKG